jgi:hypothetical protein
VTAPLTPEEYGALAGAVALADDALEDQADDTKAPRAVRLRADREQLMLDRAWRKVQAWQHGD